MANIEINLKNIEYNCKSIKRLFPQYKYYMGVVKSNAYGLGIEAIKTISKIFNYLVVSNLDEAIEIRKNNITTPILVLLPINPEDVKKYVKYDITATLDSLECLNKIKNYKIKIHIKIDTGMNRFGFKNKDEFLEAYDIICNNNLILEGIYTHLYYVDDDITTQNQIKIFKCFLDDINYLNIPIIHIAQSLGVTKVKKIDIANGIRIGDLIYGLTEEKQLNLKSTFNLTSEIVTIKKVKKNETVGYDAQYKCKNDEFIGIIPIGYSHGLTKNHINSYVYINNKKYKIIGNTMNVTFIKIDDNVKITDKVYIYKDINHINEISKKLKTVPQELMTIVDGKIKKEYIK